MLKAITNFVQIAGGSALWTLPAGVNIFVAGDIIFAKVGTCLHLDQDHGDGAGVLETVFGPLRDVDGMVLLHGGLGTV